MRNQRLAVVSFGPLPNQVPVWRALARRTDIEVRVFYATQERFIHSDPNEAFGNTDPWDLDLLDGYPYEILHNQPRPWLNWRYRYSCPDIAEELKRGAFTALVLIGKEFAFYWQALRAARKLSIPVLYMADTPPKKNGAVQGALAQLHRQQFYRRMSAFLIGSRDQYDYYQRFGIKRSSMFWAPVCIDNERYQELAKDLHQHRDRLRQALGFNKESKVLCFVGRFAPGKRPLDLLQAYTLLNKNDDYGLLFIGDGALLSECQEFARHAATKKVRFVGFKNLTEIGEMYAAADCVVMPSAHETWGLVVNEAMNFSLPVIASDGVGAAQDLVLPGKTGYRFPVGDFKALSKRIGRLFEDPHQRALMGVGAKEIVSHYSVHARVEGILQALYTLR